MKAKLRLVLFPLALAGSIAVLAAAGTETASACVPPNCPHLGVPTVTTSPATGTTANSATLNGSVNPNGFATTCFFNYGPTAAYGYRTADQSVTSGSTPQSISANLAALESGTTFHYSLSCTNPSGTSNATDAKFATTGGSTSSPPPASVLRLSGRTGFASSSGVAEVFVGCYGATKCSGAVTLSRAGKVVGRRASFVLGADSGGVIHVQLNAPTRRQLRRAGHVVVTVRVSISHGQKLTGVLTLHLFK